MEKLSFIITVYCVLFFISIQIEINLQKKFFLWDYLRNFFSKKLSKLYYKWGNFDMPNIIVYNEWLDA